MVARGGRGAGVMKCPLPPLWWWDEEPDGVPGLGR